MAKLSRGKSTSTSSAGGRGGGLGFTFLLIAAFVLLILLTAAGGVVANLLVGAQTARNDLNALLTSSQSVQTSFQQQRYRQLQLISRIFATDPVLTGYLAEAAQRRDRTKILDLVEEYQNLLTFDLAFVLDRNGVLLARTDDPQAVGEDISQTPIVAVALEDDEAFGVWQQGDRLYHAVAVPLVREFDLVGYILVAFTINDSLALQLKRMSGADVVFLLNGQTGPMVAASTLDSGQQAELISALRLSGEVLDRTMRRGETVSDIDLAFRGTSTALIAPLKNAAEAPVGAALSVIAAESRQAGYRQTLAATLASAGAALLAAFVVAFALGRRPFKPLKPLADSAVALAEGDTHQVIETDGLKGDYHRIGNSLDAIAADQREQRALQAYVTHISRYQPEPARYEAPPRPETDLLALMMIEFRRFANPKVGYDAEESLGRFGRDLRRVATMVAARKGSIEAALGHRVLIRFTGDDAPRRALGAAAEVLRMLSERENVFDEPEPPVTVLPWLSAIAGGS
ncbi:MAG: cache domain-containing protein, partial [Acidobacteriota bacterium]